MTRRSLLLLLLLGILLAACAPSSGAQPTPDVNATINANAQTMVAALFLTQTALAPTVTNTALPTATSLPTSTALTSLLATPTTFVQQPVFVAASATPTGPTSTPLASSFGVGCNNMRVINNYTVPDSPLNPGQDFTQYWQVENNGTCDWLYVYDISYASGDKFGETTSQRLGKKIEPGKWTTFSMVMHAPNKSGNYKAAWRLTDGGGTQFGAVLIVSITVGGPTKTPKPDTSAQQTETAAAQQTAVQDGVNTAIAQTQTKADAKATATCTAFLKDNPPPCP